MMGSILEILSDILLGAGALAAAFYCVVLSRKLNRLTGLDQELGGAIALLSQQVDEMTAVLQSAQTSATGARDELDELTVRAEGIASRLHALTQPSEQPPEQDQTEIAEMQAPNEDSGGLKDGATSLFVRHAERAAR
ncbi:hypothetical protein N9M66_00660 [Litoreibacter sp.]|nr:hypothetical protein [Litoreibacter sp.]